MAAPETTPITKPRLPGSFEIAFRLLLAIPLGLFGLCAVVLIVLTVILAPWLAPYDPIRIMVGPRLAPPSLDHFLGTDQLGRDVFSRVLVGGRIALLVALASIGAAVFNRHAQRHVGVLPCDADMSLGVRSEEHTSELQSLMRTSYAVFCFKTKQNTK